MRKRYLVLIAVSLVLLTVIILVTNLSVKNNTLGFISDDTRQVALVTQLYSEILNKELKMPTSLNKDTSIYINFITYGHYVISNEAIIDNSFANELLSDKENAIKMTLSNEFDVKDLTLKVHLKEDDNINEIIYTYKLGKDKKNGKISYELLKVDYIGG